MSIETYLSLIIRVMLAVSLVAAVFTGCAKKPPAPEAAQVSTPGPGTGGRSMSAAEQAALDEQRRRAEQERLAREQFVNQDVYFDFDSYTLRSDAKTVLEQKASWMQSNPGSNVQIEGHADERGTNAYNLALGERRANAAKQYLVTLGVNGGRMSTISYGEEQPFDTGQNETAWARNRRAHFAPL